MAVDYFPAIPLNTMANTSAPTKHLIPWHFQDSLRRPENGQSLDPGNPLPLFLENFVQSTTSRTVKKWLWVLWIIVYSQTCLHSFLSVYFGNKTYPSVNLHPYANSFSCQKQKPGPFAPPINTIQPYPSLPPHPIPTIPSHLSCSTCLIHPNSTTALTPSPPIQTTQCNLPHPKQWASWMVSIVTWEERERDSHLGLFQLGRPKWANKVFSFIWL